MMKAIMIIVFLCSAIVVGAQQEVEMNYDGIVLPRTDSGSEVEGSIRYNPTTKEFQGYNGIEWIRLNSEKKERQLVLSSLDFNVSDGDVNYVSSYSYASGTNSNMFQGFYLPKGAKITSLEAALYDDSDMIDLELLVERQRNEINGNSNEIVAAITTSGAMPSFQVLSNSNFIAYDIADIAREDDAYFVSARSIETARPSFSEQWPDSALRVGQVIINYTIE